MNEEEMHNAINKGIPNQIKLELPVEDLVNYCPSNSIDLLKSMNNIRKNYENAITSICGYNKSGHEFFNNLRLITDYKNSNTNIYVSPVCFLKRLKTILGVTNESLDLDDPWLISELNNRLFILNSINDIDDLKDKFPIIFDDYKNSLLFMDMIHNEEKINPDKADLMRANYQKYGLDTRFKVFLSNQKMMYTNFVQHAKEVFEYANNNEIKLYKFEGLDKDKFELYVANKYLEYAKNSNDDKDKQSSIYYLTTYLNESCGHVINMPFKDKNLSNVSLLKDFRKFLKENPRLKPINESREVYDSYHIKHVKNHINKYLNSLNNWNMLRMTPSEILQKQQARLELLADYTMKNPDYENRDEKHKLIEKYIAMLIRKLDFYENSNYELRLFGTGPFDSHVAYFYPNGMVAVDKLYDESLDINPTYNEAIYVMNSDTFLKMMSMDKPRLRENDNVKRIIHSGSWEDKVKAEIENPTINLNKDNYDELASKYRSKVIKKINRNT